LTKLVLLKRSAVLHDESVFEIFANSGGDTHQYTIAKHQLTQRKTPLVAKIIQGDSRGKINIFGSDNTGYCEKKFCTNLCLILNGYGNRAV
jgi:hypothetical protein